MQAKGGLLVYLALVLCVLLCVDAASTNSAKAKNATQQNDDSEFRIYNGADWPLGFSWMVNFATPEVNGAYMRFCGGTMITSRWVMTAAHCFYDEGRLMSASEITILYGNTNHATEKFSRMTIHRIVVHETYVHNVESGGTGTDVALAFLDHSINITPIRLNVGTRLERTGRPLVITGWGMTYKHMSDDNLNVFPNELQQTIIKAVSSELCEAAFASDFEPGYICAAADGNDKDSCGGDSGGPLHEGRGQYGCQVGIVSYGPEFACNPAFDKQRLGAYVSVSYIYKWVQRHVPLVRSCE